MINAILVWILGIVFVASAVLKALDATAFAVQVSYYGIIRDPVFVRLVALALIGAEGLVGGALLMRIAQRRITLPCAFAFLFAFSLLLAWAMVFRDIENCGCFGKYLSMTPGEAIGKNIVLMALAGFVWMRLRKREHNGLELQETAGLRRIETVEGGPRGRQRPGAQAPLSSGTPGLLRVCAPFACAAALVVFAAVSPFDSGARTAGAQDTPSGKANGKGKSAGKFAKYTVDAPGKRIDLSDGLYLVSMLSDSCSHCAEDVAKLNRLMQEPECPVIVGLVLGEEDTLQEFRKNYAPKFPTRIIPVLEFFNLIGDAPPRFALVQNGRQVAFWDEKVPEVAKVLKALSSP